MAVDEHLQTIRHSLAHVMAEAISHLFPGAEFAIGPAIENGFYYDIDFKEKKITEEDFPAVEKEMRKILAGNFDFVRKEIGRDEALKLFAGHQYKTELINDLPADATISIYTQDDFTDLCRGPHVANTKEINAQAFKLTKLAGAYCPKIKSDTVSTVLALVSSAAMNIGVHVYFLNFCFLRIYVQEWD